MNERGQLTVNTREVPTIMRIYYEKLYAKKLGKLKEMDKFLETYQPPKLKQDEIEILNKPVTTKEIESVMKNIQTEVQGWMDFQGNSTKHLNNS